MNQTKSYLINNLGLKKMKLPNLYYKFNYKQLHSFRCKTPLKSTVLCLSALLETQGHIRSLITNIFHVPKFLAGQSGNFRLISGSATYQLNIDVQAWPFIVKSFWLQWHRSEMPLIIHMSVHSILYSFILGILKGQSLSRSIIENVEIQTPGNNSAWEHKLPYIHCHFIATSHKGQLM